MADDDLKRRLEKLVALRDHPSTLPAIRDAAAKAADKLQTKFFRPEQGEGLRRGDLRGDPLYADLLGVLNRETRKIWKGIKPKYPHAR